MTELRDVLSERDLRFLALLDRQAGGTPPRPGGRATILDLDRVADILDGGEPAIVYQPIVNMRTGSVEGYEALARFGVEPQRTPDVWFNCAQQVGLGTELEVKAVRSALASLPQLPASTFLSVNVSAATLVSPALHNVLAGVPGDRVVIEVTEHEFVEDYEAINDTVYGLRARGFRLAVDDAGSGCAGLGHIVSLAPDVIKLDGTITGDIERDAHAQEMVSAVVVLARYWGSTVVAEGIENTAQLDTLRRIGVDRGQGYLLGRPAPLPDAVSACSAPRPDAHG